MNPRAILLLCILVVLHLAPARTHALEAVPDKLVVLTFDDSVASHHSVVRPLLKRYRVWRHFFITEGFSFRTNKQDYMTWEQIAVNATRKGAATMLSKRSAYSKR